MSLKTLQSQDSRSPQNPVVDHSHLQATSAISPPNLPLGVGTLIRDSFSITIRNFVTICVGSLVPMLLFFLPATFFVDRQNVIDLQSTQIDWLGFVTNIGIVILVLCSATSVASAFLSKLTYESKLHQPIKIVSYLMPVLSAAPAIALLTIFFFALFAAAQLSLIALMSIGPAFLFIGFLVIFVAYFWTIATFCLIPSAAVIEQSGFRSLKRSMTLTSGYRLPVLGAIMLAGLCSMAIQAVLSILSFLLTIAAAYFSQFAGAAVSVVTSMAIFGVMVGFLFVVTTLIYIRLREIKEGVSVDQIEAVFE